VVGFRFRLYYLPVRSSSRERQEEICAGPQHRTPSSGHVTEIHEQYPEIIWTKREATVGDWTKYGTVDRTVCPVLLAYRTGKT